MGDVVRESLPRSIRQPIPAIFQAWELLSSAADAHLRGDRSTADALFRQANMPEVWHWTNPAQGPSPRTIALNVKEWNPEGDTQAIPKPERYRPRDPTPAVKAAVRARDGYRCRYCGIPVIDARIRKIAHSLYPDAIPWKDSVEREQHAAFQCFWLQYDHVVPHSHGGSSSEDNIVVTCALCNYGKDKYTIRQLGISDPRLRQPESALWDGLERLNAGAQRQPVVGQTPDVTTRSRFAQSVSTLKSTRPSAFFLPKAWISSGYLYTPPLDGKARWFKLGADVVAEPVMRDGVSGCRLVCDPEQFRRRGLLPDAFLDPRSPPRK